MGKKLNLYNLNFLDVKHFKNFNIDGYSFYPISTKQPARKQIYSSGDFLKSNRKMHLNSYVIIPNKQESSIFYKGGKYSYHRERKFLDDLLNVISILVGRNVVTKFWEKYNDFPLCSSKHCSMISVNSTELQRDLEVAVSEIKNIDWQQKYDNGFHIVMFYNGTNVFVQEHRFLANMAIWEYLFYCDNRNKSYDYIENTSLNAKICFLVKKYFLHKKNKVRQENLRIFSDLRNQLSHSGKLPIKNPKSRYQKLSYIGCGKFMELFQHLTQVLVLKTVSIEALDKLNLFNVGEHLTELLKTGTVSHYESLDKSGNRL